MNNCALSSGLSMDLFNVDQKLAMIEGTRDSVASYPGLPLLWEKMRERKAW